MATIAQPLPGLGRDDRFFLTMSFVMVATMVAGFSTQLAMGRSSFASPLIVHVHAVVFFGWATLYLLQNLFVTRGSMGLHRTLGWIGAGWATLMVPLGMFLTIAMVRRGNAPFFFQPAYFLIMNTLSIACFGGLTAAALVLRRRTAWHRRLHYCGMAVLSGPAFGRLLPMPLLIPWAGWWVWAATLIFPVVGLVHDHRRHGRVHPAWRWGLGSMVALQVAIVAIAYSPVGAGLYRLATAGAAGERLAPLAFPAPPSNGRLTGRTG